MKGKLHLLIGFLGLAISTGVLASPKLLLPLNCQSKNIRFSDNSVHFSSKVRDKQQRFYAIKNESRKSFWLQHLEPGVGAKAGWSSELRPGRITVLAVDRANFNVECTVIGLGTQKNLVCQKVISVCEVEGLQLSKKQSGTYWFVENEPKRSLQRAIAARQTQEITRE